MEKENFSITRISLGDYYNIGSLYNQIEENFITANVFKQDKISDFIKEIQIGSSEVKVSVINSDFDKFDHFELNVGIKLSILLGLVTLSGSANYFKSNKIHKKTQTCVITLKLKTFRQYLNNLTDIKRFCQNFLTTEQETLYRNYKHFISEIEYGGLFIAEFSLTETENESKNFFDTEIGLEIKAILVNISCGVKVEIKEEFKEYMKRIKVSLFSDFPLANDHFPGMILSIEDFTNLISNLKLITSKSKGIPLNYKMLAVKLLFADFDSVISNKLIATINESILSEIHERLITYDQQDKKLEMIVSKISNNFYRDYFREEREFLQNLIFENNLRKIEFSNESLSVIRQLRANPTSNINFDFLKNQGDCLFYSENEEKLSKIQLAVEIIEMFLKSSKSFFNELRVVKDLKRDLNLYIFDRNIKHIHILSFSINYLSNIFNKEEHETVFKFNKLLSENNPASVFILHLIEEVDSNRKNIAKNCKQSLKYLKYSN